MKVVILCGGLGTRLREETEVKPKPMVEIGGKPILWHIMQTYASHGYKEFIICLGYKGEVIKHYFLNYESINNDFTVDLSTGAIEIHNRDLQQPWRVTLVDTGLNTMTGARVKRIEEHIDEDYFLLTYGDGVTDLDINQLVKYHHSQHKIGTVTGVSPPSHYGQLDIFDNKVVSFREKPEVADSFISGGYFVFHRSFFEYLSADESCVLEREPLSRLAEDGQLAVYTHRGFWQCMDTPRDYVYLQELWDQGKARWRV